MKRKPSRLALPGLALICAAIFAACSSSPVLTNLLIAPNNGTLYVSAPTGVAIKGGARRAASAPVRGRRRAAAAPQDITTAVCGTLQYAATGFYSNGTSQDQTTTVTWSSSSTSVATIGANTGLATGVGLGLTNIGATLANVTASTVPLEVDQLNSITMNPTSANIPVGATGTVFMAIGNFTLAAGTTTTQDISSQVTWASSNMNVATVDSMGNVTTVGQGMTNITATSCDGVTVGTAAVTVGAPATTSLKLTPIANPVAAGTTVTYTVVQLFSDGSTQPLPSGTVLSWQSSMTSVATIVDPATGLTQALTAGSSSIMATAQSPQSVAGLTGSVTLTVQAAAARFAYVANTLGGARGTGSISSYIVNVGSSTPLTPNTNDPSFPTGEVPISSNPQQVLLHPSGDLLFYIDSNGNVGSNFVNSATGVFSTATGQTAVATKVGGDIYFGVIDPTGRFLFVVSQGTQAANGNGVLYGFTINHTQPSGGMNDAQLTGITGLTTGFNDGTLVGPTWILTDQTGNYLYIINGGNNTISEYAISQASATLGQLTPLGSPVGTGVSPLIARIDTNGHLFVANQGDATHPPSVSAYNITGSGASAGQLTLVTGTNPTPITGATDSISVIANPNGNFLYVLDFGNGTAAGQVFTYGLNSSTGAIGSAVGTAQPTDITPFGGMAIDPTGALLVIDNYGGNDMSMYTIGSNGGLTPTTPPTVGVGTGQNPEYVVFYTAASGQ